MPQFTPVQLAERLKSEGEKTIEFFRAIPPEKWHTQIYTDGESWTVHQILTHLTQAETSIARLLAQVAAGQGGVPPDFDLDGYNERKVKEMQNLTPEALLLQFAERRANTISFVANLTPADLQKTGRHPFLGVAPLHDMIQLIYRHTQLHQRDIRKTILQ